MIAKPKLQRGHSSHYNYGNNSIRIADEHRGNRYILRHELRHAWQMQKYPKILRLVVDAESLWDYSWHLLLLYLALATHHAVFLTPFIVQKTIRTYMEVDAFFWGIKRDKSNVRSAYKSLQGYLYPYFLWILVYITIIKW